MRKSDLFWHFTALVCMHVYIVFFYKQLTVIEVIIAANRRLGVLWLLRQSHVYTISSQKLERGTTPQRNIWKRRYPPVVEMQK